MRFQELVEYKREHGDTFVPAKYPNSPQLGLWVSTQRTHYNRKKRGQPSQMTEDRIDKLNEIGLVWYPNDDAWNEMFQQLVEYKKENGDILVPKRYTANPQLGIWVTKQRFHYKRKQSGHASQITNERVDKLNKIDFVWDVLNDAWSEKFQQLVEYKKEHGDTLVPQSYPDNPPLGIWVNTQRSQHNRKQRGQASQMTDERKDKLNGIGFVWEPHETAWQSKYNELHSFYKEHDHTKIPFEDPAHQELYDWCMRQRHEKAKGKLPRHRFEQMKMINFDFFVRKMAKGSSLIECMTFYELEQMGHEFDMLNKGFFDVRLRPDGVIFQNESVIFVEVDEKYHGGTHYPIEGELGRMVSLREEAVAKGYGQVIFVRIGTGDNRKVDESQLNFVSIYLNKLKSSVQSHRFSVHYIDYPDDHHHVLAAKESFENVHVKISL